MCVAEKSRSVSVVLSRGFVLACMWCATKAYVKESKPQPIQRPKCFWYSVLFVFGFYSERVERCEVLMQDDVHSFECFLPVGIGN